MPPPTCSECLVRFPDAQIQSMEQLLRWLDAWPLTDDAPVNIPLAATLVGVRDRPDCMARCSHGEPPLLRHPKTTALLVSRIPLSISQFIWTNVEIEAVLQKRVLTWLQPEVAVDENSRLAIGPVSRKVVMLVNNMLQPANDGPASAVADRLNLMAEGFDAFKKTANRALWSCEAEERLQAADLIVLNWLSQVVRKICDFALSAPEPAAAGRSRLGTGWRWIVGGLGVSALIGAAVAGGVGNASEEVRLASGVAGGIGALAAGLIAVFARKPAAPPVLPNAAAMKWALRLKAAMNEAQVVYEAILSKDENSLEQWNLLQHAGSLFENTRLKETSAVAIFLIQILETPMGLPLVKWIIRNAAKQAGIARICDVAEALLDQDRERGSDQEEPSWTGSCIAGLLVREFMQPFLKTKEQQQVFWSQIVPVNRADESGHPFDFPRVLRRLLFHAALLEDRKEQRWTVCEGQAILACRELAVICLPGKPKADPHWTLLQIRFLADAFAAGLGELRFPSRTNGSLITRCEAVETALLDHLLPEEGEPKDGVNGICRKFHAALAHAGGGAGADPDDSIRKIIVMEALDVMMADGFLLSKSFLLPPPETPVWRHPGLSVAGPSMFDAYINCKLGEGQVPKPILPSNGDARQEKKAMWTVFTAAPSERLVPLIDLQSFTLPAEKGKLGQPQGGGGKGADKKNRKTSSGTPKREKGT